MEPWRSNLLAEIDTKRASAAKWAARMEYASYIGLTLASVCSAVAALSIASKSAEQHPFWAGFLALVPAIWLGIEKGLKPRQLAIYNSKLETDLRVMRYQLENSSQPIKDDVFTNWIAFLKAEENSFEQFMNSFEQPQLAVSSSASRPDQTTVKNAALGEGKQGQKREAATQANPSAPGQSGLPTQAA